LDVYEPYELDAEEPEIDDFTPESYDAQISAELLLPKGCVLVLAQVIVGIYAANVLAESIYTQVDAEGF
jgi:hypothetical protein